MFFIESLIFLVIVLGGIGLAAYGLFAILSKKTNLNMPNIVSPIAKLKNSIILRAVLVIGIILIMLIPLNMVSDKVDERSALQRSVIANIASMWGDSQRVSGPILAIPYVVEEHYTERIKDKNDKIINIRKTRYLTSTRIILPEQLAFNARLNPQTRKYGIYEYVVYTAPIEVKGSFKLPAKADFPENTYKINWDKAWLAMGITDLAAITEVSPLNWNNKSANSFNPDTRLNNTLGSGFHSLLALNATDAGAIQEFSTTITLNGSGGLHFTPVGKETDINISGEWAHPRFSGSILPTKRTITATNFEGTWHIPHLSRNYPQNGDLGVGFYSSEHSDAIRSFVAGVNLFETVSLYSMIDRATKYGILFIGLTFIALFSFELITRQHMHLLQYALVGVGMALFYLVLLSLAEHTSFLIAFCAAAAVSTLMNSLYVSAAMHSKAKGFIIALLLVALYALLYALMQMEDYALMVGTTLVVIAVAVLMFLTRNLSQAKAGATEPEGDANNLNAAHINNAELKEAPTSPWQYSAGENNGNPADGSSTIYPINSDAGFEAGARSGSEIATEKDK